jgi:hypothetical protein
MGWDWWVYLVSLYVRWPGVHSLVRISIGVINLHLKVAGVLVTGFLWTPKLKFINCSNLPRNAVIR